MRTQTLQPLVLVDSREQTPWTINAYPTETTKLDVGDYGVRGLSDWSHPEFIVERKTIDDLVSSLIDDTERFWKELRKMRQFRFSCLLIEADYAAAAAGAYRSKTNPKSILAMLDAIAVRCNIHVIWCGDHERAARRFEGLVRQKVRGIEKNYRALARASEETEDVTDE